MHIEIGILNGAKLLAANAGTVAVLTAHVPQIVRRPGDVVKTLLAAVFFSLFMQMYHMPVGPSELHFIGASATYFLFGFLPTLFGFALGLLLQAVLFEPMDIVHLGVNSLSLIVPLIAVHYAFGKRFFAAGDERRTLDWKRIAAFDAAYYAGVTLMVAFWLFISDDPAPLADWALFALSYAPLVLLEPIFTWGALKGADRLAKNGAVRRCTAVDQLALA